MTATSAKFLAAIPVIPVDDAGDALAFYRDKLGFTLAFQVGDYCGVQRDGVELHLDASDASTRAGIGSTTARVNVAAVDALYAEVEPSGVVDPAEPLETKPWGTRQFSVRDRCGNRITFAESAAESA